MPTNMTQVDECPWHPGQPDSKECEGCLAAYEAEIENVMDEMRLGLR